MSCCLHTDQPRRFKPDPVPLDPGVGQLTAVQEDHGKYWIHYRKGDHRLAYKVYKDWKDNPEHVHWCLPEYRAHEYQPWAVTDEEWRRETECTRSKRDAELKKIRAPNSPARQRIEREHKERLEKEAEERNRKLLERLGMFDPRESLPQTAVTTAPLGSGGADNRQLLTFGLLGAAGFALWYALR